MYVSINTEEISRKKEEGMKLGTPAGIKMSKAMNISDTYCPYYSCIYVFGRMPWKKSVLSTNIHIYAYGKKRGRGGQQTKKTQ